MLAFGPLCTVEATPRSARDRHPAIPPHSLRIDNTLRSGITAFLTPSAVPTTAVVRTIIAIRPMNTLNFIRFVNLIVNVAHTMTTIQRIGTEIALVSQMLGHIHARVLKLSDVANAIEVTVNYF